MSDHWPRLSETLPHEACVTSDGIAWCQRCETEGELDVEIRRWQEHDGNDRPEPRYVLLCGPCGDRIVDPHPRLYRKLGQHEPAPGAMPICAACVYQHLQEHLGCGHPDLKANGGPGLQLTFPRPTEAFVDGVRGGRRTGWRETWYSGPVTRCVGRAVPEQAPQRGDP